MPWLLVFLTSAPRTAIYRYGTTSVVNPGSYTNTIIKYDTAVTDSTGWYDNTNGRFTPTVAGWYQVSAGARVYGGSSTIEGYLGLFKNGTQIAAVGGQGFVNGLISLLIYFNGSTDYIQLYSNTSACDNKCTKFHKRTVYYGLYDIIIYIIICHLQDYDNH